MASYSRLAVLRMGIVNHIFQKNGQVLQLMISLKIKALALLSSAVEFTSGDRAFL
tara:strand:+ start:701 stop:865 length:165 start_codon:yes stop_codon:yes gene_type:complete